MDLARHCSVGRRQQHESKGTGNARCPLRSCAASTPSGTSSGRSSGRWRANGGGAASLWYAPRRSTPCSRLSLSSRGVLWTADAAGRGGAGTRRRDTARHRALPRLPSAAGALRRRGAACGELPMSGTVRALLASIQHTSTSTRTLRYTYTYIYSHSHTYSATRCASKGVA